MSVHRVGCVFLTILFGVVTGPSAAPGDADEPPSDALSAHAGMIGFGFFTTDAPVGIRRWGQTVGLEAGVGFRSETSVPIDDGTSDATTSLVSVAVEGGLLFPLAADPHMILYFRPGMGFRSDEQVVGDAGEMRTRTESTLSLSATIGTELFLGVLGFPNLSFGGGIGLIFESVEPADGGDTRATVSTSATDLGVVHSGELGFHLYF